MTVTKGLIFELIGPISWSASAGAPKALATTLAEFPLLPNGTPLLLGYRPRHGGFHFGRHPSCASIPLHRAGGRVGRGFVQRILEGC
jgi:hypothetical protein